MNSNGVELKFKYITATDDQLMTIILKAKIDITNNFIYLCGLVDGDIGGEIGNGSHDALIMKYDLDLNLIWT